MKAFAHLTLALALALTALGACNSAPAGLRAVDDSYTISQRWAGYKDHYPGIALPVSTFQAGQQVLFDRRYKTIGARELRIDIFLPPPGIAKHQGIVLVHGGAWRSGSKSHFYALANLLAQRGYAVFLPEYRLAPEARYPAGLVDVDDAIVWVKSHADEFGIPKDKLALGGASSGGQMASLLAYSAPEALYKSSPADDTSVNALVDLDGVLDFTTPMALHYENAAGPKSPAAQWLGGSYEQAPRLWKQASAVTHISQAAPPTLILSSGLVRFTAGSDEVRDALARSGTRYEFFAFQNAPHDIWLFEPWLSQIVDRVDAFLQIEARK
ncbi:alpha/beta fold hydrolase [Asticcacaulis solisilvae]|uniref:alpha/beta fold hydrolase n=1 Tax=Asticcacaulis solisilvae TaxID=1217274 RepID=UPI003FD73206